MAKSLADIAAEKGFTTPPAAEPAQEVQEHKETAAADAQEVQEGNAKPALNSDRYNFPFEIPEPMAEQIKRAAAGISGENPDNMTVEQAVQILGGKNPNPVIDAEMDRIANNVVENLPDEYWESMVAAAQNGQFAPALMQAMQAIAQEVQESTEPATNEPNVIRINTDIDPKLNPNDPAFDIEAWKAALSNGGETPAERMEHAMQQVEQTIFKGISEIYATDATRTAVAGIAQAAKNAVEGITAFINSDIYKAVKESMQLLTAFVEEHREEIEAAADAAEELKPLIPFLQIELEEMKNDPQFADCTLSDLLTGGFDADGNEIESPWRQAIERAKERKAAFDAAEAWEDGAGTLENIITAIPLLEGIKPQHHTMPNNALMNALESGVKHTDGTPPGYIINAGAFDLPVAKANKKRKEITAYTMVSYDPGETGITITDAKLTEYERQVSDAIISLYVEAKQQDLPTVFTTDMIYRAMPGNGGKASAQQKGAITKTIEKLRRLHITVDATEEMQKRGKIKRNEQFTIDNFYLSATRAEYKTKNGGQIVAAYKIEAEPIIYTYSRMTKQILTVPAQYIEIMQVNKKGKATNIPVAMTADRQAMTGYLLRQIAKIKYDHKNKVANPRSNIILFETLFNETGTNSSSRTTLNRNRDFIFSVLDYETAAGYISGYEQQTKGRSITGVKIKL